MKSFLKYLFIITIVIIAIIASFFYFYKSTVINNLTEKNKTVTSIWSELYENSNNRIKLLKTLTIDLKDKDVAFDSLKIAVDNNYRNRGLYKDECSLNFVKQEYDLDKVYLKIFIKYSTDSILKNSKEYELLKQVNYRDNKINDIIEDYNNATLDYNKYISIFPNFIFAKRNGFSKKKYFTIKFGKENEDPIVKSKKLPEWAKDKDTL